MERLSDPVIPSEAPQARSRGTASIVELGGALQSSSLAAVHRLRACGASLGMTMEQNGAA
jgi:hypothetical protein